MSRCGASACLPSKESAAAQQSQTREQLEALANQLAERDQQLRDQRLVSIASQEELERLRAEITALRKTNQAAARPEEDLPEFATRQAYIDHDLEEAGWSLGQGCTHEHEVQGMPNATGQGLVDYVLWGDDGKRQAELYANCLEQHYGQRPLIFLSNGYRHRLWDDLRYPPHDVQGFYKKAELQTMIRRHETRQALSAATISSSIAGRYYQQRAIRAIGETLEQGAATGFCCVDLSLRCHALRGAEAAGLARQRLWPDPRGAAKRLQTEP